MNAADHHLAARTDASGRLVEAAEPLASLQLRCGGAIPGAIAIPALAELVAQARRFGLRLARPMVAQDGDEEVRAWAEIEPLPDDGGCRLVLRHWQAVALAGEDPAEAADRRAEIDRVLAELTARLDARQGVLSVECEAADLAPLAAAMRDGVGRPWTEFVEIVGDSHRQPLHWRLLDGCTVRAAGSARAWRVGLVPVGPAGREPAGFELLMTSDTPPDPAPAHAAAAPDDPLGERVVGRELAPVLRQPIARIIANAETIRLRLAGPLGDEYAQYAADIAAAGQHLLELVDDIADLEVIEAETFTTARDAIDLADVARRACGLLGMRAREKRIVLAPPPEDVSLPATAEFRRVLQVLLNLVGNAIRYSPEGTRVELRVEPAGSERARVIVADQGPGLDADQQARVFEKYERLGRSGDGGTGLGLYISRRLARAMDGELGVESAPGEGARFILTVPAG
ncbi:MAG: sensor histidine kinase [Sphingomonadales bacterium]|nr:sensor histidine kinase [Sphingomonadales bacterium]